jgi:transcriptional regulator with XRE-family HTH domain
VNRCPVAALRCTTCPIRAHLSSNIRHYAPGWVVFIMYKSIYGTLMHQMRTVLKENILRYRLLRNLTQTELAEAAEVAMRTIQKLEYGETWPSDEMIDKIAEGLGIEPHLLFMPPLEPEKAKLVSTISTLSPAMIKLLQGVIEEIHTVKGSQKQVSSKS